MALAGSLTYKTEVDQSGIKKGLDDTQRRVKGAGTSIKNIVAGLGITKLISTAMNTIKNSMDGAISRIDTMNNFPKVMSNLGIGAEESTKAVQRLSDGLQGIPTTLDAGAMAVQRFTSKNEDVQKSVDIFLAVNDAILAGGASTQIQESALEQLSQAYSKGKMDMVEWRTLQTAMPAQLKQVATAMGVTTDELGEMLRTGDNTEEVFDEFIETIIKMDKTGVKGFKSLKEQAKNATGGINTSITNMKTAITRGVADMIQQFDKVLKDKGFGSISQNITKFGKEAEGVFKKVASMLPAVIDGLINLFNIAKDFAPLIIGIATAFLTYKTAMDIATTATKLWETVLSLDSIGVAIAGFVALTAAIVAYSARLSEGEQKTRDINKALDDYNKTMKDVADRRQENLDASMQEIYNYQSLYEELQKITDENGKVKEGYEKRAKVITDQLSSALGIEISMTDGVIKNYQGLKKEINETIEYKKALSYFNAHEEQYNEAVKNQTKMQKEYNEALKNSNQQHDEYNKKLEQYAKDLGVTAEHLQQYVDKGKNVSGLYKDLDKAIYNNNDLLNSWATNLRDSQSSLDEADKALQRTGKTYADNQEIIYNYNTAQQELADGNYEAMFRIFNDTVTFNAKTEEANNKKYEDEKARWESYRSYLEENKKKYDNSYLESEYKRIDDEIAALEKEKNEANKKIEEKNKQVFDTTLVGINDQLKALRGRRFEFRDAGDGNVQLYVDGVKKGQPISEKVASNLATGTVKQISNKKMDAKTAGEFLIDGVNIGVGNKKKQSNVFSTVGIFANGILGALRKGLKEHSPSKASEQYGKWLLEGLNIGVNEQKNDVLNNIDEFSNDIVDRMANAVNIQNGKMAFSGTTGSINQILTATGTTTVVNENKLLLDGDVVYENQKKVSARKNLQTQFGGAYNVFN